MSTSNVEGPVIIAMKGRPCTGKSTMAQKLAKTLKYFVIADDDVRQCIAEKDLQRPLLTTATERLNDITFDILYQIASIQLQLGHQLIIDSSLRRRDHLDRLLQLSTDTKVIVECVPRDRYEWRQWLERRHESEGPCWYKPLLGLEDVSAECSSESEHDMKDGSKLVVDTTDYVKDSKLADAVYLAASSQRSGCIDFHEWVRGNGLNMKPLDGVKEEDGYVHYHELILCNGGHENTGDFSSSCGGCLQPISESDPVYYKCNGCSLFIHKLCAELPSKKKEFKPHEFNPPFLQALPYEYIFPETCRCRSCETSEEGLSFDECPKCLFETNLCCALLPPIVHHNCHEHPLTIMLSPFSYDEEFVRKACGESGQHVKYSCSDCGFGCHLGCALLPQTSRHKFHRHPLKISTNNVEEFNEFYCDVCETEGNPKHWIYYCDECHFSCHLKCRTFDG